MGGDMTSLSVAIVIAAVVVGVTALGWLGVVAKVVATLPIAHSKASNRPAPPRWLTRWRAIVMAVRNGVSVVISSPRLKPFGCCVTCLQTVVNKLCFDRTTKESPIP